MLMKIIDKNISILEHEFNDEFENSQRDKYLVFNLCDENYALEISYVAEIIEPGKAVFFPEGTAGTIFFLEHKCRFIPAVSLRKILNRPETKDKTAIIINTGKTQRALVVDWVIDIEDIDIDKFKKTIKVNGAGDNYIKAVCRINGHVINILSIEKIFSI